MEAAATVVGRGTNLQVQHGTDDNLLVRFYFNKVHEEHYVKINVPGDNKTEWDRPVTEQDKRRFAEKWRLYEAEQSQFTGEVLIEGCELFDENKTELYRSFNIRTLDQLCNLNDAFISRIGMGTRDDVRKAKAYLASLSEQAKQEELNKELLKRDDEIAKLKAMVEQLASQSKEDAPKRGRPPKEE